jgi:hypothetical protein
MPCSMPSGVEHVFEDLVHQSSCCTHFRSSVDRSASHPILLENGGQEVENNRLKFRRLHCPFGIPWLPRTKGMRSLSTVDNSLGP